jgi:hypothetical protein
MRYKQMKHLCLFLLIFLFLIHTCYSQQDEPAKVFNKIKKEFIEFKSKAEQAGSVLPFSNIKVIDKRYDTSCMGYMKYGSKVIQHSKLVTKNNLSADLENYLSDLNKKNFSSNNKSLVMVIKKLWFHTDYNSNKTFDNAKNMSYFFALNIDFYIRSGNLYTPFMREDTIIKIPIKVFQRLKGILIGEALQNVFNDLLLSKAPDISSNKITFSELNTYYEERFNLPIFYTSSLQKGVYMTFEEFKNNAPSVLVFEVTKTKLTDDIYVEHENKFILNRTAWGYCDGTNTFVKLGMNLFQLFRQGFTYSLFGNTRIILAPSGMSSSGSIGIDVLSTIFPPKSAIDVTPIQLDMETGKPN